MLQTEVRCLTWDDSLLPQHSVTFTAASEEGKEGEGIVVAARKHLNYHAQDKVSDTDSALWVKVQFEGGSTPLVIGSSYVPPAGSRQLQTVDLTCRFTGLCAEVVAARAQGNVLLAGDFNARVSNLPDGDESNTRGCTDEGVNAHGSRRLEMCKEIDMLICTGKVVGDLDAAPTFKARTHTQATKPDNVLVSVDALPLISQLAVNTSRKDSDHHPIEMTLHVNVTASVPVPCIGAPLSRVKWQPSARNAYADALRNIASASLDACKGHAVAGELDAAFQTLEAGIREAAAANSMPARTGRHQRKARADAPFFDSESRQFKRDVRARARCGGDPTDVRALERAYHNTVRHKRRAHRLAQLRRMLDDLHIDPRASGSSLRPESLIPLSSSSQCNCGLAILGLC